MSDKQTTFHRKEELTNLPILWPDSKDTTMAVAILKQLYMMQTFDKPACHTLFSEGSLK